MSPGPIPRGGESVDSEKLLRIIRGELVETTGCTDPGAIVLAVAVATQALGRTPGDVEVVLSPEVYKNAVSVGIPGAGRRGAEQAAALGVEMAGHADEGLAIMNRVTAEKVAASLTHLEQGRVRVGYAGDCPDKLYIQARVRVGMEEALAVIQGDYDAVSRLERNGRELPLTPGVSATPEALAETFDIEEALDALERIPVDELEFLLRAAEMNKAASDLKDLRFGGALAGMAEGLTGRHACVALGKLYTGAAVEARMCGLVRPITAIAGSGNIGIIALLGVLGAGEGLEASREKLIRALAVSTVVTITVKRILTRMTNVCGCTVAGASGVAAGTVSLLGGSRARMDEAIQAVLGAFSGVVCDGAKESCAYKASATAGSAIEYAFFAVGDGVAIPPGMGVVGSTLAQTLANLGKLNEQGMREVGSCILEIIKTNQKERRP